MMMCWRRGTKCHSSGRRQLARATVGRWVEARMGGIGGEGEVGACGGDVAEEAVAGVSVGTMEKEAGTTTGKVLLGSPGRCCHN